MQAKDIMTTNVVSISPAANIRHTIALMLAKGISGLPVIDDAGHLCAILTEGDLMTRWQIKTMPRSVDAPKMTAEADLERHIQSDGWSVNDVMSPNVIA